MTGGGFLTTGQDTCLSTGMLDTWCVIWTTAGWTFPSTVLSAAKTLYDVLEGVILFANILFSAVIYSLIKAIKQNNLAPYRFSLPSPHPHLS